MTTSKVSHDQNTAMAQPGTNRKGLTALVLALSTILAFASTAVAKAASATDKWNVEVDRVDSGTANLEPSFSSAIYENLLDELSKTKQFSQVFRSGDHHADAVADLLILKIIIEKYIPGSETRRAVATFSGATRINARFQLMTKDGRVLLERAVGGNVRFIGNNLRATHNLSHNVAKTLKHSAFPGPATSALEQESGKESILTP